MAISVLSFGDLCSVLSQRQRAQYLVETRYREISEDKYSPPEIESLKLHHHRNIF